LATVTLQQTCTLPAPLCSQPMPGFSAGKAKSSLATPHCSLPVATAMRAQSSGSCPPWGGQYSARTVSSFCEYRLFVCCMPFIVVMVRRAGVMPSCWLPGQGTASLWKSCYVLHPTQPLPWTPKGCCATNRMTRCVRGQAPWHPLPSLCSPAARPHCLCNGV